MKKYHLYIDESGDHGLVSVNTDFPVFLLCGILISEDSYHTISQELNIIKREFWENKDVIFHSRDIRKCNKEFQILFDLEIKKRFYERINSVIQNSEYHIITSIINKEKYIKTYGRLSNDVYELALSFIIERAVFFLDDVTDTAKQLDITIEKRGKKEDKKLDEHFQRLLSRGTSYVSAQRLRDIKTAIAFKDKKENINGLQLADLIAYPIARYVMEPNRANPAFDVLKSKIYTKNSKKYGLKIFP
ncbi:MAG: DUF3800 domain-containing protein [Flavobacteriaceae bacterium]|jgi:hypothetical protein|nr:DUF3800 domain-containing protein [Flavobacteriaceae bacterium]